LAGNVAENIKSPTSLQPSVVEPALIRAASRHLSAVERLVAPLDAEYRLPILGSLARAQDILGAALVGEAVSRALGAGVRR
jgi:hypothetical protein